MRWQAISSPSRYTDAYRDALKALIDAKVEGRELVAPAAAEERGVVVDLMAALEQERRPRRSGRNARSGAGTETAQRRAKRAARPAVAAQA